MPVTSRSWRIARAVLASLLALLLVAFAAAWWLLAGGRARLDGTRAVAALQAPVTISRDALGTVTIEGGNRADVT